ncbi:hypothetical protein [Mucilaginibacter myungsuensis]|uniref:Lipoprotein n=1 Tax=Mucilaginibacter myungsuensis TaxID=649104 RepID=A0A929L671_9SPHI|nr:hypothetical protein [Mucilaginibacter myungsuensis]MBE9663931.1 hypothetical protein [Mucilaginibacter myungsuensis]MDN3598353.1 hypothetical protein [Mucilaginibacter myungsuensis]
MKTITQNLKQLSVITLLTIIAFTSCKKDTQNEVVDQINKEQILEKKILDIIPQQYQDTLAKLGITLNRETTPPDMQGAFTFKPLRLLKSNRPTDQANMTFKDADIKFFEQDKETGSIKLISKFLLNDADTSIATAVSGKGNAFTIYGKVKSVSGSNSAIFGVIISGERNGALINNLRFGLINIDNTNGGTRFIKQGEARAIVDADFVSQSIPMF